MQEASAAEAGGAGAFSQTGDGSSSDPGNDVSDEVSVDPVDGPCVDISHLEQGRHLRVPGTTVDPDHIRHPPVAAVFDDDRHPCFNAQKDRIRMWRCDATRVINRHGPFLSTGV